MAQLAETLSYECFGDKNDCVGVTMVIVLVMMMAAAMQRGAKTMIERDGKKPLAASKGIEDDDERHVDEAGIFNE